MQWDDLRVFLAVAQAGSLRRAGGALRIGQPTVVRHLRQLERALGARLFERTRSGHRLTRAGQDLLPLAQSMADTAVTIDRRRVAFSDESPGAVRVVAGEWASRFLATRLVALVRAHRELVVELAETHSSGGLDQREGDLFVRHGLPARGHLLRVGLGSVAAAVYGARDLIAAQPAARTDARWRECPWVAYDAPHEYFRTMVWLAERIGNRHPRVRASRFGLQLEAIRTGAGLGILPCFVGDADHALMRLGPPVPELAADHWLLVHPDLKSAPRIRLAIDWIRAAYRQERTALEGRRPSRAAP